MVLKPLWPVKMGLHRLFFSNLGYRHNICKLQIVYTLLMIQNAPTSLLVTAVYVFTCLLLQAIDVTRGFGTIMLYALPAVVGWMAWAVFTYAKSVAQRLKDDEFGYGG